MELPTTSYKDKKKNPFFFVCKLQVYLVIEDGSHCKIIESHKK